MRRTFLVLLVLVSICFNTYELSTRYGLSLGGLFFDYAFLIVFFNVTLLVLVCVVDYIIEKVHEHYRDYEIGEGLSRLHQHEL